MEEQLLYLREASDEQLVRQIDFVLEKLNSGIFRIEPLIQKDEVEDLDAVSEDGNENDDLEDEEDTQTVIDEDEAEELFANDTDLNGERLLATYARRQYPSGPQVTQQSRTLTREPPMRAAPPFEVQNSRLEMPHAPVAAGAPLPEGDEDLVDMVPPISPREQVCLKTEYS